MAEKIILINPDKKEEVVEVTSIDPSTFLNYTPHEIILYFPKSKSVHFEDEKKDKEDEELKEGDEKDLKYETFTIPSQKGAYPRLTQSVVKLQETIGVFKFPVYNDHEFTGIENVPEVESDVNIIVSSFCGKYLANHPEKFKGRGVYSPLTDPENAVRDKEGKIIGTKAFTKHL